VELTGHPLRRQLSEETGERYRLPTEAEWEFAARDVHFNSLFPYVERRERRKWYIPLCIPMPRPLDVGSFQPNLWGLYDMHGNVQGFTSSPWRDSHVDLPRNGVYRRTGNEEWVVVKGGSWFDPAVACRSAARRRMHATEIDTNLGFRVLREF
jgi:formylglycine-generating enzyme required for sulfatase activity